jgi:hypothetical protein
MPDNLRTQAGPWCGGLTDMVDRDQRYLLTSDRSGG